MLISSSARSRTLARTKTKTKPKRASAGTRARKVHKTIKTNLKNHHEKLQAAARGAPVGEAVTEDKCQAFKEELLALADAFRKETMPSVETAAEEHEQNERLIERESWQAPPRQSS